jgi:hypothetical protein
MKRRWATDHRAAVLEAVACSPVPPRMSDIIEDAQSLDPSFRPDVIRSMVWQLDHEELIARNPTNYATRERDTYHITKAGLDALTSWRFDKALPSEHTRPKSKGKKTKS